MSKKPKMKGEFSDRGFFFYKPINGKTSAGTVAVSDSSAWCCYVQGKVVEGPFLWLRVDTDVETYHSADKGEGIAHLTRKEVQRLRDQLDDWLVRHEH